MQTPRDTPDVLPSREIQHSLYATKLEIALIDSTK